MALVKVTCPRCDGTGHYSYNPIYGTVCLKCKGEKYVYMDEAYLKRRDAKRQTGSMLLSRNDTRDTRD
jgi:DnaJ-class molecular chaperone